MGIVNYYCRSCRDYTPHAIIDQNTEGQKDYTKLECIHEDAEAFIVEHAKGKPPTEYSKRVEMADPEE